MVEAGAPAESVVFHAGGTLWRSLSLALRRFPQRVREGRFWRVQALVLVATVPHYAIESSGGLFPAPEGWHFNTLVIALYILPLLYAALNYSWEGAVLTALWVGALTLPSLWYWGLTGTHWATDMGQLTVVLPVGLLVAWRVGLETTQRRRAEATSARLAVLNEIGESLGRTMDVEQQLPGVLRRLLNGFSLEAVWLCLEPESGDEPVSVIAEAKDTAHALWAARARDLHQRVASSAETLTLDDRTTVIPLVGEGGALGSLGAVGLAGEPLADEQLDLLATVAHEVRVAVENARLYRERQESMHSYVRQVTQAQEDERLRIARELHDETAQELVHLVRKLEQLGEGAEAGLAGQVQQLVDTTRETLRSVRRFSRDLRPPVLDDLGLLAALETVVEDANRHLPEGARLEVSGEPARLNPAVELALFRVAQEALRNVEKHARAASATVKLEFNERDVCLLVADDGQGFAPPRSISNLAGRGKLGLLGMKERAELVGGKFDLTSRPGEGTRIAVRVERTWHTAP